VSSLAISVRGAAVGSGPACGDPELSAAKQPFAKRAKLNAWTVTVDAGPGPEWPIVWVI
jgi:hypothetical protein